jgi:WXXGXW repeat (2 copies)
MRNMISTIVLAGVLFSGVPAFGAQISIGIQIGAPPRPRVVRVLPRRPGPEFIWIQGYWYPVGRSYRWHEGYWTLPPYVGARWVSPRYDGSFFYVGYWNGPRGRFEHDHHWDHEKDRDFHGKNRGRGRGR